MCMNANTDQHMQDQYGLDRSTFKFMIDSDDTIKVLNKLILEFIKDLQEKDIREVWLADLTDKGAKLDDLQ